MSDCFLSAARKWNAEWLQNAGNVSESKDLPSRTGAPLIHTALNPGARNLGRPLEAKNWQGSVTSHPIW